MYGEKIKYVMDPRHLLTAAGGMSVAEGARMMAERPCSAVLVVDGERLAGIFTERDAVHRVIALGLDPRTTELRTVMTPDPVTIDPDRTFGQALLLMHERSIRHVPVMAEGKPVGMVTARDALDPEMEEFICEAQRRSGLG